MQDQYKVYDYINNVISLAEHPEDFKESNFAILCDRYPIQLSKNKYLAKVIYISIKAREIGGAFGQVIKNGPPRHRVYRPQTSAP